MYIGQWKDGVPNGIGKEIRPNEGIELKGKWRNTIFDGKIKITKSNGRIYNYDVSNFDISNVYNL